MFFPFYTDSISIVGPRIQSERREDSEIGKSTVNEAFNDVIREYIDFVNRQVHVYMDALAGFEFVEDHSCLSIVASEST